MRLGLGISIGMGTARPWSPLDVTGLKAYYDADDLEAADVSQWDDLSPNAKHATQATGANRPQWSASVAGLNNQAGVYFAPSGSDFLTLPNLSITTTVDIFAVVKADLDPSVGGGGFWDVGSDNDPNTHPYTDGIIYDGAGSTTRKTVGNVAPNLAAVHIYHVHSAAGNWTAKINGTQVFTTGTNTFGMKAAPTIGSSAGGLFFNGYFAKLLFCSAPAAGDEASLLALWADQYGITL